MAKGILYIMTTVVDGLIKIGKTQTDQFENRMRLLESNGYRNVTGLKRKFAIEVDEYDEKEILLHNILDRSRVPGTELFAMNVDLAVQLMSALEGKQIYPKPTDMSKAQIFSDASESVSASSVPNGTYFLKRRIKSYNNKEIHASLDVVNGKFIVLAGSEYCPIDSDNMTPTMSVRRKKAKIKDGKLAKDEEFTSSSYAAMFILGYRANGLISWKDKDGTTLGDILYPKSDD